MKTKIFLVNYDKNSPYVEEESYYESNSLNDLISHHEDLYGMSYVKSIKEV
tara:strand:- start:35 stop:187 length:153 start_codon:yes stop_codon:yes gene_type:complete